MVQMFRKIENTRAGKGLFLSLAAPALCILLVLTWGACTQSGGSGNTNPRDSEDTSVTAGRAAAQTQGSPAPEINKVTSPELLEVIQKHRNKVVVLKFWATWCPPCVEEMPKVIAFYNKYAGSEDVALVSVSADLADSINDTVAPFLKEKGVPFPVWVIDAAGPEEIVARLGLDETRWEGTLPAAFVFDKQGRLSKFWIGPVPEGALEEAVKGLL